MTMRKNHFAVIASLLLLVLVAGGLLYLVGESMVDGCLDQGGRWLYHEKHCSWE